MQTEFILAVQAALIENPVVVLLKSVQCWF